MVVSVRNRAPVARRMPTCPPQALPTQSTGSGRPSRSSACSARATTSSKVKSRGTGSLLPCDGPSIAYTVRRRANSSISGPQDWESTNRLCHNTTGGPVPVRRTCSRPRSVLTKSGLGVIIAPLQFTSGTETSVAVVFSDTMAKSRDLAPERLAVGQLLVRLLREFRDDLAAPRADAGYGDVREPHFQIFGNIRMGGIRLTELADRAQLSLAATSELVNDLADMGYLTRRPDPADGRAKLIELTKRGRDLMADAGGRVADIEHRWSALAGERNFTQMCRTMQRLLDELNPQQSRS